MPRITYPATIEAAPEASREMLNQVKALLGSAPNLFRLAAISPAALEGYLGLFGALGKGRLPVAIREKIALAISQYNACGYCVSAHTYLGQHLAKLTADEIALNRRGRSSDPKADAAVVFALKIAQKHGRVSDSELATVREAGFDNAQIIEMVQHVALNTWTNYLNELAQTEIDFPVAEDLAA